MRVLVLGGFVSGAIAAERNVDGLFFAITKDGELNSFARHVFSD